MRTRSTRKCHRCQQPLDADLVAAEPEHHTHPTCDPAWTKMFPLAAEEKPPKPPRPRKRR